MARLKGKDEEIKGKLDQKYWVQKSDPLVLMRSVPFSLGELKVLDTYISRINAADESRTTVIFTKEEYEELMGISKINADVLKKHAEGLLGKIVTLEMPDKSFLKFVLFTAAYYHLDDCGVPIIELSCSPQAKDLFFCIGKYHYFSYALENVIKLTHKASYLLYIYVLRNRYQGEWDIDLDELRDSVLDCKGQESYLAFKEFKRAVLDPAVKEVNKKTDCHFAYEAIKRGRRVVKIKFICQSQDLLEGQTSLFDEPLDIPLLSAQSEDEEEKSEDEEEKWIKFYGSERLAILAEGCNYEFGKEDMEQIAAVLVRINIPKDRMTNDLTYGRQFYLREKYAALNAAVAKKERRGQKPITDRFKYFLGMLENDAVQPASY